MDPTTVCLSWQERESAFPDGKPFWPNQKSLPHDIASVCTGSALDACILENLSGVLAEHDILPAGFSVCWSCECEKDKAKWIADVHEALHGDRCCNFTQLEDVTCCASDDKTIAGLK